MAFTADPVTGTREEVVITAVRGLGDRLVDGEAVGDQWVVRDGRTVWPAGRGRSRRRAGPAGRRTRPHGGVALPRPAGHGVDSWSVATLAGSQWKIESALAKFCRRHLAGFGRSPQRRRRRRGRLSGHRPAGW
ncbi:MAG TPA: PEP/pyruvate-binding domain-containing protein [Streptosporangiaceae bacterium]